MRARAPSRADASFSTWSCTNRAHRAEWASATDALSTHTVKAFNMGTGKLKSQTEWPKLNAAIGKKDWGTAAAECNRPDSNARRNSGTKALFTAAAEEAE